MATRRIAIMAAVPPRYFVACIATTMLLLLLYTTTPLIVVSSAATQQHDDQPSSSSSSSPDSLLQQGLAAWRSLHFVDARLAFRQVLKGTKNNDINNNTTTTKTVAQVRLRLMEHVGESVVLPTRLSPSFVTVGGTYSNKMTESSSSSVDEVDINKSCQKMQRLLLASSQHYQFVSADTKNVIRGNVTMFVRPRSLSDLRDTANSVRRVILQTKNATSVVAATFFVTPEDFIIDDDNAATTADDESSSTCIDDADADAIVHTLISLACVSSSELKTLFPALDAMMLLKEDEDPPPPGKKKKNSAAAVSLVDSRAIETMWLGSVYDDMTNETLAAAMASVVERDSVFWEALRIAAEHAHELHVGADAMEYLRDLGLWKDGKDTDDDDDDDDEDGANFRRFQRMQQEQDASIDDDEEIDVVKTSIRDKEENFVFPEQGDHGDTKAWEFLAQKWSGE